MALADLPTGIYRHYKGPLYLVFGYGHDANQEGRITVEYVGLELNQAHTGPRLANRTAVSDDPKVEAWWDQVHSDGTKCCALIPGSREVCDVGASCRASLRVHRPKL